MINEEESIKLSDKTYLISQRTKKFLLEEFEHLKDLPCVQMNISQNKSPSL